MASQTVIRARELRAKGYKHADIARECGVSRQRINQILGKSDGRYFAPPDMNKVKYPNLAQWMIDNRVSRMELARRAFGADAVASSDSKQRVVSTIITGEYKNIPKPYIDALIKATGLSYEVLFAERVSEDA